MGMYTLINFAVQLDRSKYEEIRPIIEYMMSDIDEGKPEKLPNHPFFETERWTHLFKMDSAYFEREYCRSFRNILDCFLQFQSNLKNDDDEIEKFLNWISPYIIVDKNTEDRILGFVLHEEDFVNEIEPNIILYDDKDSKIKIIITKKELNNE